MKKNSSVFDVSQQFLRCASANANLAWKCWSRDERWLQLWWLQQRLEALADVAHADAEAKVAPAALANPPHASASRTSHVDGAAGAGGAKVRLHR